MLLIADKPANQDMSVAARLSRKQRLAKLGAEKLLNNGTSTDDAASMEMGQGQPPLSMILPRRAISDPRFVKMLPEEQSPLVEVQRTTSRVASAAPRGPGRKHVGALFASCPFANIREVDGLRASHLYGRSDMPASGVAPAEPWFSDEIGRAHV